jgi:hypothetical protein
MVTTTTFYAIGDSFVLHPFPICLVRIERIVQRKQLHRAHVDTSAASYTFIGIRNIRRNCDDSGYAFDHRHIEIIDFQAHHWPAKLKNHVIVYNAAAIVDDFLDRSSDSNQIIARIFYFFA